MPGCLPVSPADSLEGAAEGGRDKEGFGSAPSEQRAAGPGLPLQGCAVKGRTHLVPPAGVALSFAPERSRNWEKTTEAQGSVKPLRFHGFLTPR